MSPPQAVVLTYHRIVPDGDESKFHDVSSSQFRWQMEFLSDLATGIRDGAVLLSDALPTFLTFDDGTSDHALVGETLSDLGLVGAFFVVTGRLGTADSVTVNEVRQLDRAGHRIASHSVTHRQLTRLSDESLRSELVESRARLEDIVEKPVDWFAPPGGDFDERVMEAASSAGYELVRTMDWGYAKLPLAGNVSTLPVLPTFGRERFAQLVRGQAPLWRFHVKQGVKRLMPERQYVSLRNAFGAFLRSHRTDHGD